MIKPEQIGHMRRIAVIGRMAAGKSTFSASLSTLLGIEVHHLDRFHWQIDGKKMPRVQFDAAQAKMLEQPSWIIDGHHASMLDARLEHADTIIFLDLPTITCLWGGIRRYFQYRGRSRPDMVDGNVERLTWGFFKRTLRYRRNRRPFFLKKLEALRGTKNIITLESRSEVRAFLQSIASKQLLTNRLLKNS
jgi:adenylate kinase family enzyme